MTPYYQDDACTIYHGDAVELMDSPELAGPFSLGFADPPYNYGFEYGPNHDDSLAPMYYELWCGGWFKQLRARCTRVIVTSGHGNLHQWTGRKPSGIGCWYKPGNPAGGGIVNFCEWEPWFYWGPFLGGSDVIRATVTKQPDVGDHPCPKPLSLLRHIIARTKPGTVLDPFMGSGTTLVAAKSFGARSVGIEQNERYCEIAAKRLAQEVLAL